MNIKIAFAPKFLVEGAIKKFGLEFYSNLMKACKNFKGSDWERAVQRRPDLFNFFKKIID